MGRAFTDEEKKEIRKELMEVALDLFHDKGIKSLSIKELTKRVGIAQGSFYNFWKDKDALIIDLIAYRSDQKLKLIEEEGLNFTKSPVEFLIDVVCDYFMDLAIKIEEQVMYQKAFKIFLTLNDDETSRIEMLYIDFLSRMIDGWIDRKLIKNADKVGLSNVLTGSFILCINNYHFNKDYFEEILRLYLINLLHKYIEV